MNRLIVIVGAIAVVVALVLAFLFTGAPEEEAQTVAVTPPAAAPAGPPEAGPAPPPPELEAPSFDIVRVEPSGETVIAGRAAPGAEVTVLDRDQPIGTATADQAGEWVLLPKQPLAPGSHELGLRSHAPAAAEAGGAGTAGGETHGGGTASGGAPAPSAAPPATTASAPSAAPPATTGSAPSAAPPATTGSAPSAAPPATTESAPSAGPAVAAGSAPSAAPSPSAASSPAETQVSKNVVVIVVPEPKVAEAGAPAPEAPIAMLTPREGTGASRVLQQPGEGGLSDRDLVLNAVDYDETGRVIISGQAVPGAIIFIYLDDKPVVRTVADDSGRWEAVPGKTVAPGLHSLQVDQVNGVGSVLASVSTPFSRATLLSDLGEESFVVVQPGNSLWRIARRSYGQGIRYTVIYEANRSQIRDPDLIYPGQIFQVPSVN